MTCRLFAASGLVLAMSLVACGGGRPPIANGQVAAAVDPETLCLSEDCASRSMVGVVPDAENILYASNGQVFVSGGTHVFEVRAAAGQSYTLRPLAENACNFTGLAERANTVYAACGDQSLYAMSLLGGTLLQKIHTLEGMSLPNGMAVGPDDCLYIVDGPLSGTALPSPKVERVCLSFDPLVVASQETWLDEGLELPNGIAAYGQGFVLTNSTLLPPSSQVLWVGVDDQGLPTEPTMLYSRISIFDDLSVVGDHILVSDFAGGSVFMLNASGEVVQETAVQGFAFPSALQLVGPPQFQTGDILVSEKGILGDTQSSFGNALTLFRQTPAE